MKAENQCCAREQAQRLAELGVGNTNDIGSIFYWVHDLGEGWELSYFMEIPRFLHIEEMVSAFTVSELGVMLPPILIDHATPHQWHKNDTDKWLVEYFNDDVLSPKFSAAGDTEAQARAAMIIFLLENNLITADEVNKRLQAV